MTLSVHEALLIRQTAFPVVISRHEHVQDVVYRLTALTGSFLSRIHTTDSELFTTYVPGLSHKPGGSANDLISIRGISTRDSQFSSDIGMYQD